MKTNIVQYFMILAFGIIISGCDPFPPVAELTITKGNSSGVAFVKKSNEINIRFKVRNDTVVVFDHLEFEYYFQFGTNADSNTVFLKDATGGGMRLPLLYDVDAEYNLIILDSDSRLQGFKYENLTEVHLVRASFWNKFNGIDRDIGNQEFRLRIFP